jgi:uncharacterized damage-inducible protein DinB
MLRERRRQPLKEIENVQQVTNPVTSIKEIVNHFANVQNLYINNGTAGAEPGYASGDSFQSSNEYEENFY